VTPRRQPPDTRLRWDDPALPFFDSKGRPWEAERARKGFETVVERSLKPSWRDDPTYNLRKDQS
jgi:hypothetical protein